MVICYNTILERDSTYQIGIGTDHVVCRENPGKHLLGQPYLLTEICYRFSEFKLQPIFPLSYQIQYLEKFSSAVGLPITFSDGSQKLHCWHQ